MYMIPPATNGQCLCSLVGNDAGNVFMQIISPGGRSKIIPVFNSKHAVDDDLGVGVPILND